MDSDTTPFAKPPQYAMAIVEPGALLLDTKVGSLFELNATALFVWQRHLDGLAQDQIVDVFCSRYGLDRETGGRHVSQALATPDVVDDPFPTDFNYSRSCDGSSYVFAFRGEPIFSVDDRGTELRLVSEQQCSDYRYLLRAMTPKLAALHGQTVMHASAVLGSEGAIVFPGPSGAGKTTTARAFRGSTFTLISEDQTVLTRGRPGEIFVTADAEASLASWVTQTVQCLLASGRASCDELDQIHRGNQVPLLELGFLSFQRRVAGSHVARQLSPLSTAAAVFRNIFYGSDMPAQWQKYLDLAATIGHDVAGFELSVPEGIDNLAALAAHADRTRSLRT